ncbi:MAG: hypothetical protein CM1200mP20_03990 [Pseudomonadota bacterium]|nr:MAG: hypothetical protein CM1200mP20_03990 [Pseudomonadota bacterium]
MMLSVFRVHNLIPGPKLFETQSEFVVGLYVCLFLINFIVLAFLLSATPLLIRVIRVPERFLGVVVLTLALVGVYSIRNSLPDCWVAIGFGLVGFRASPRELAAGPYHPRHGAWGDHRSQVAYQHGKDRNTAGLRKPARFGHHRDHHCTGGSCAKSGARCAATANAGRRKTHSLMNQNRAAEGSGKP